MILSVEFFLVFLVGAAALIVEALRQYPKPLKINQHDRYPLLQQVDVNNLAGRGEYIKGFIVYIIVVISIYTTLLIFPNIYSILYEFIDTRKVAEVGQRGAVIGSDGTLNLVAPLVVSSTLIAAASVRPFAEGERWIRGISHKLAGVPRGIYHVLTKLNRIPYTNLQIRDSQLAEAIENLESMESDLFFKNKIQSIKKNAGAIGVLYPYITNISDSVWTQQRVSEFNALTKQLSPRYDDFVSSLTKGIEALERRISSPENSTDPTQTIEKLADNSSILRNDILSVFALFFISERNVVPPGTDNNFRLIIRSLRRMGADPLVNSLWGTAFVGAFIVTSLVFIIDFFYVPEFEFLNREDESVANQVNILESIFSAAGSESAKYSFIFSAKIIFLFVVSVTFALANRESKLELDRWPGWSANNIPFARFVKASLFPSLLTCILYLSASLVLYILAPFLTQKAVGLSHIMRFVSDELPRDIMIACSSFIITWFTFILADTHDFIKSITTLLIGVIFSLLFTLYIILTFIMAPIPGNYEESVLYIACYGVAVFFLCCCFSAWVEVSELKSGRSPAK